MRMPQRYRDLLSSVRQVSQKQKITEGVGEDKDIHCTRMRRKRWYRCFRPGWQADRQGILLYDTCVRKITNQRFTGFCKTVLCRDPIYSQKELMLQYEIEDAELIEKWLSERKRQQGLSEGA